MRPHLGLASIIGGCATSVLISQAAWAATTEIQSIQVNSSDSGVVLILESSNGEERPQIFTVSRGNSLVADMINARLNLPDGNAFLEENPAPGIASVSVTQLDENSVRITVNGEGEAPVGQVQQDNGLIIFSFDTAGASAADAGTVPPLPEESIVSEEPLPEFEPEFEAEGEDEQVSQIPEFPEDTDVLVPDPTIRIDGNEVSRQLIRPSVPPTLPRAIAPPVGDIATSTIDVSSSTLELGTQELIPRLVLRDAPVREVLALLARAAGLNLAYTGTGPDGAEAEEVRISIDVENEPIEDVFNYVVRLSGIQVSRFGRTIFAGPRLPNGARDVIARSLRLNQVDVSSALQFLVAMGAESSISQDRQVTVVDAVAVSEGSTPLTQTQTFTEPQVTTLRAEYQDSDPILRGLVAIGDQRTNSLTLIGEPRIVQAAIEQLIPLDIRRRQVAVNVRVIDVDLNAVERFSSSFSFGIDDTRIINSNGVGLINFDEDSPAETTITPTTIGDNVAGDFIFEESDVFEGVIDRVGEDIDFPDRDAFAFTSDFLAQLQFAVTNGSAKILTDPTLVVQEGQSAEVVLAQEVITNVEIETEGTGDDRTQTVTVETEPAGVILRVQVDRIDDNGFVTLSVAPTVSAPGAVEAVTVEGAEINLTLLSERRLTSGQLRIRDGQTLILSGIIQDSDRVEITKFPILGDIPIIGALFRRTSRTNERNEVIVVMTTDVLDDSEFSTYGYSYDGLSPDSQQLLRQ